ncbi:MAG: hypothetical protein QXI91_07265, partial [Candidatus Bathyarchaeia archaeon]
MKLPHWLLRLLPMWGYICPKCKREVKANIHNCPHCGEWFPFPLKVPPKCLKDPKALEDYVHKHVFPKISAWQREYLAQFFTVLFADGFESGDFSAWTGTVGSPTIVSSPTHHGAYAARFGSTVMYCYKTFTETNPLHVRVYVYFTALPPSTYDYDYYFSLHNSQGNIIAAVGIRQGAAGQYQFVLRYEFPSTTYLFWSSTPQVNTWYCFELKFVKGTSGEYRLYIDGVERITASNVDTSGAGTVNTLRVGAVQTAIGEYMYADCCVIADTYIGLEPAEQWHDTATWSCNLLTRAWHDTATWTLNLLTRAWHQIQWAFNLQILGWHNIIWTFNMATKTWHDITWNLILGRTWHGV